MVEVSRADGGWLLVDLGFCCDLDHVGWLGTGQTAWRLKNRIDAVLICLLRKDTVIDSLCLGFAGAGDVVEKPPVGFAAGSLYDMPRLFFRIVPPLDVNGIMSDRNHAESVWSVWGIPRGRVAMVFGAVTGVWLW